jgi:RND family efflux transporter MFP subunit
MKKSLLLMSLLLFVFACNRPTDKKAELEKLKKQHDELATQISKLEAELTAEGGLRAKTKNILVTEVTQQVFYHYIEIQGRVGGDQNIAVNCKTPGFVASVNVEEGQAVRKGQLLATLDASVLLKTKSELEAQLVFATDIYNKQKNLWDQKIGSEVQYLTAKNNKESLENKMKTLQEQIDMMRITSPIDGTVEEIPIKIGQVVSPGIPTFRVVNFSSIKVMADIAEAYSARVKTGDSVIIHFPDFNYDIKTKLSFTSKYISPINRTFQVEARITPGQYQFRANMIAVLRINDYKAPSAFVVPVNIIQKSMNEQFVFVSREEKGIKTAHKQTVTVGQIYNGMAEVLTGLNVGDKIITTGYQDLNEGQALSY